MATIIKAPNKMSAPLAGTPYLPQPILVSDTFSGAGNLTGRTADCLLGGTPAVWSESNPGYYQILNGALRRTVDGSGVQGFSFGLTDMEIGITLGPLSGSSTTLYLDLRRATLSGSTSYRLSITVGSGLYVTRRGAGSVTTELIPAVMGIKTGDKIALRAVGGDVRLFLNGVQVGQATDPTPLAGTWATFSNSAAGYDVDDFYIQKAINR